MEKVLDVTSSFEIPLDSIISIFFQFFKKDFIYHCTMTESNKFWSNQLDDDDDFEDGIYGSDLESEEDSFGSETEAVVQEFSDEEEETRKAIRSTKDKKFEELKNTVKNISNKMIIDDWAVIAQGMFLTS